MGLICLQNNRDVQPEWYRTQVTTVYCHIKKTSKVSVGWGSFQEWIWHVNGMSTTKDLLHDMYCILLRCGSFQNESGMCTKSIREVVRAMMCSMDANYTATTWKPGWCLTFYIPVWASSWGTRLYVFFRNSFDIFQLI